MKNASLFIFCFISLLDCIQNELKRLREIANSNSWNDSNDLSSTWTDILEGNTFKICTKIVPSIGKYSLDDQSEINEYLKYQRIIRELKDENSHLRNEMANLRKSRKSQQSEINQVECF